MLNAAIQGAMDAWHFDLFTTTPAERAQRRALKRRGYDKVNKVLSDILALPAIAYGLYVLFGG